VNREEKRLKLSTRPLLRACGADMCGGQALQIVGEHKDISKKIKGINSIEENVCGVSGYVILSLSASKADA
jgi:hypothetical protein